MKRFAAILLTLALALTMVTSAMAYTYHADYRLNDHSDDVKQIQSRLVELEYLTGKADGWFGEKTRSAVKRFQMAHDMEVTGVADEVTQSLLFSDEAKVSPQVLMSLAELKQAMSESGKLGVKYDLSDMEVDKHSGVVELNNYVVLHCELLGDDVTEIMLVGKDNVKIPFTMLLMALDKSIGIPNMSDALDVLIEQQQRTVDGKVVRYEIDSDQTQRLIVTPLESGTVE